MKPLTLISVVTENYLSRAEPFLRSLENLQGAKKYCVCLGWTHQALCSLVHLHTMYPGVNFVQMPSHWSADKGIFQHGRWLDVLPDVADDHLYMLTDADILVQRDFTEAEIVRFNDYDRGTFGAGWNAGINDHLLAEAERMGMSRDPETFSLFPPCWLEIPCLNTGVIIARGCVWKRLRDLFESRLRGFWKVNPHRSRTQWLVNFCLHRIGIKVDVLPPSLHCHGHHPVPQGVSIGADGIARYRGETIMFRHAM